MIIELSIITFSIPEIGAHLLVLSIKNIELDKKS